VRGTGLGAYSARLMARTLGGDISLQSAKETGTCVTVSLPVDFRWASVSVGHYRPPVVGYINFKSQKLSLRAKRSNRILHFEIASLRSQWHLLPDNPGRGEIQVFSDGT